MIGQFHVLCGFPYNCSSFPAMLWSHLLLPSSKHWFPPSARFPFKWTCVFDFVNHFLQTVDTHRTITFFHTSYCPELLQSYCRTNRVRSFIESVTTSFSDAIWGKQQIHRVLKQMQCVERMTLFYCAYYDD